MNEYCVTRCREGDLTCPDSRPETPWGFACCSTATAGMMCCKPDSDQLCDLVTSGMAGWGAAIQSSPAARPNVAEACRAAEDALRPTCR